jgi:hypothetical protein
MAMIVNGIRSNTDAGRRGEVPMFILASPRSEAEGEEAGPDPLTSGEFISGLQESNLIFDFGLREVHL